MSPPLPNPELQCENPTLPGCANPDDHLRWFGASVQSWVAQHMDIIATVALAILLVLALTLIIDIAHTALQRRQRKSQFTEDDIIGDAPLDEKFPFLRKQDEE